MTTYWRMELIFISECVRSCCRTLTTWRSSWKAPLRSDDPENTSLLTRTAAANSSTSTRTNGGLCSVFAIADPGDQQMALVNTGIGSWFGGIFFLTSIVSSTFRGFWKDFYWNLMGMGFFKKIRICLIFQMSLNWDGPSPKSPEGSWRIAHGIFQIRICLIFQMNFKELVRIFAPKEHWEPL